MNHRHLFEFCLGYVFSTDSNVLRILNEFQRPINSLTFSLETTIVPMEMEAFGERDTFILSSIVNERCSVAISTDVPVQLINIQERNKKKLSKLKDRLSEIQARISEKKYIERAKVHTKERDLAQVRNRLYLYCFLLLLSFC